LAGFIRALDAGIVHLVGGSYGGIIATNVALQYPDLVKSLVLSEPGLINAETPEAKVAIAEWNETILAGIRQALNKGDAHSASVILWNGVNEKGAEKRASHPKRSTHRELPARVRRRLHVL